MGVSPNSTDVLSPEQGRLEGNLDSTTDEALTLDLSDQEIASIIGKRVENSVAFWNREFSLDSVRESNVNYWLNKSYSEEELYNYQTAYKNNRIFTAEETLIATVMSQRAEPSVTPAGEGDVEYQLAQDLEGALTADYDDLYLKAKGTLVARHLIIGMRLGVLKYRFDPELGEVTVDGDRKGGIAVDVKDPRKIVIGEGCTDPDVIPLIAEYCDDTIENLVVKYPKKKDEIFRKFGIVRGVNSQLARRVGYVECWFDYRDKSGKWGNAMAAKIDDLILGGMKNPNYNYDEWSEPDESGVQHRLNFFDRPRPPFIIFSHLNLGKYVIDSTSLSEQAQPMQDVLNKRGRQIVDNADQAQGGLVLNEEQISQETAAKHTGDPAEKFMVKGDVRTAAARMPRNSLEPFVLKDKQDAKEDVDNIMGANAALRGESTNSNTLGQDVMSQRANMGRIQVLADAIEDGFDRLFKALTQMYMVYYDEDVEKSYQADDGRTRFVTMSRQKVNPKMKVRVRAGSMIPKDKWAIRNETIQALAILDPLSIAEGLDKPNPKEFAKRLYYYRFAPDRYVSEVLQASQTGQDDQAIADIQTIIQTNQMPSVPQTPSKDYIFTLQSFLQGSGFQTIKPEVQEIVVRFSELVTIRAKQTLGEPVTPEEPAAVPPAEPAPVSSETPPVEGGTPPEAGQEPGSTPAPGMMQRLVSGVKGMFGGQ